MFSIRDNRNQRHSQLEFEQKRKAGKAGGQKPYKHVRATPPFPEAEKQILATCQSSSPLVPLGCRDLSSLPCVRPGLLSEPSPAGPHLAPHSLLPICSLSVIVRRTSTFFLPDDFGTLTRLCPKRP